MASRTSRSVSLVWRLPSGDSCQRRGGAAQPPGQRSWSAGRKRSASGPSPAASRSASELSGTVRRSRCPRAIARFMAIRNSHVFSDERPSKRSMPWSTPSHVSCTTSSATARHGT